MTIQAVLFDLDGTLLDTAPDLVYTLNALREEYHLPPLPLSDIRPLVSLGSKVMLKFALNITEDHPDFKKIREHFLELYQQHLSTSTQLFPQIDKVLSHLEEKHIPWGIVTNKLIRHTTVLLKALELETRAGCIICGDSLSTYKPHPAPILRGCELLKQKPAHCLYVGDAATDVMASKAAGTRSLVALYGYIDARDNPYQWQADGYVGEPIEIIDWLIKYPARG